MAQGFQLQLNNGTANSTLRFREKTRNDLTGGPPPPPDQLPAKARSQMMYFEAGLGTLVLDMWVEGAKPENVGDIEIRFDSKDTKEFTGSIYVVNFKPPLDPKTGNLVYPYLILRHHGKWPFGNITFVDVVAPSLPVDPGPSS